MAYSKVVLVCDLAETVFIQEPSAWRKDTVAVPNELIKEYEYLHEKWNELQEKLYKLYQEG